MQEIIKAILDNSTLITRVVRTILGIIGPLGVAKGWWDGTTGAAIGGGALFLGAGQPNPTPPAPPAP
jgi:hypothetical protein